jgi:methionyl-tRNA formyltransferase
MKIGYFGDGPWASKAIEQISSIGKHEIAFIVARFDHQDPVLKDWSIKLDVPFLVHPDVNSADFLKKLYDHGSEILVSMSFNQIMKDEIIQLAPRGFINCHAGALPFYRGRNPLNWALINGEKYFGVTVHYIDSGIDSGDIIARRTVPITHEDSYATLLEKAYAACPAVLLQALDKVAEGRGERIRQSQIHPVGSYCGRRRDGDEWIDWSLPSARIYDFVRGVSLPGPCARTLGEMGVLAILEAKLIPDAPDYFATQGEVVGRCQSGAIVKTGDSTVFITKAALIDDKGNLGAHFIPRWRIGTRLGLSVLSELYRLRVTCTEFSKRLDTLEAAVRATGIKNFHGGEGANEGEH